MGSAIVAPYNSTGYFFGIFTFINLVLVVAIFKESNKMNELENKNSTPELQSGKPSRSSSFYVVLIMLIVIFFDLFNELSGTACLFFTYSSVYDTLATPITLKYYGWEVLYNSILWIGISAVSGTNSH